MNRLTAFIRRERLYLLLLVFVVLVAVLAAGPDRSQDTGNRLQVKKARIEEELFLKRENVELALSKKPNLAVLFSLTSLLIIALLVLGIAIDGILISQRLSKGGIEIRTYEPQPVRWNLLDVARVVILFLFFGYMLAMIESALVKALPVLKSDNLRMILNSSVLDVLTVVFIIYFTVVQYKERVISLGISFKNFAKNVFCGIVGYVAAVPIFVGVLVAIIIISNLIKYVPARQPVVDLFLKEKNASFLIYTSAFAAIAGPVIEELFFRAFMYNAVKKYAGIFWAMVITAATFAALHANIVGFFPIMVLGILLAYLYEKTGTLVAPITVHVIHNFSMILFVFLIKELNM